MRLREVRIENFRCLQDVTVPLSETTVLIGENNAGKTAFMDALRRVLAPALVARPLRFEEYDYHIRSLEDTPESSPGIAIELRCWEEHEGEWHDDVLQALHAVIQIRPSGCHQVTLRIHSQYSAISGEFEPSVSFLNLQGEPLPVRSSLQQFRQLVRFVPVFYLEALRDASEQFAPNSPFWGRVLRAMHVPQERLVEVQQEIEQINRDLLTADERVGQVVDTLAQLRSVFPLGDGSVVSVEPFPLRLWEVMSRAELVVRGGGSNINLPISRHGDGLKSVAVVLLFKAYIDIMSKPVLGEHCEPILTIEEPEAHLHPQAVRRLARTLGDLRCQKIISTHSPFVLEECDLYSLRVFRRRGPTTEVAYLRSFEEVQYPNLAEAKDLCKQSGGKYYYDEGTGMLVVREFLEEGDFRRLACLAGSNEVAVQLRHLQRRSRLLLTQTEAQDLKRYMRIRGDIFFARCWLLCEGPSDYIYLRGFAEAAGLPLDLHGVAVVDFQNNGSPAAFVALAEALRYPWLMCCDNDEGGLRHRESVQKRLGLEEDRLGQKVLLCPRGDMEMQVAHDLQGVVAEVLQAHGENVPGELSDPERCSHVAQILRSEKTTWATRIVQELLEVQFPVPAFFLDVITRAVNLADGGQNDG